MGCRVGMSTDPQGRIKHWKDEEGHTRSAILASKLTYEAATKRERKEAAERGCYNKPGGQYKAGRVWSVYHVWGGIVPPS